MEELANLQFPPKSMSHAVQSVISAIVVFVVLGSIVCEASSALGGISTSAEHIGYVDVTGDDMGGDSHSDLLHDSHFGHSSVQVPSECCVLPGCSTVAFLTTVVHPALDPQDYIFSPIRPPSV